MVTVVEERGKEEKIKEIVDKEKVKAVSKPCVDFNDHCKMWADIGHCKWSEKYMAHYCKESCDLCIKGEYCRFSVKQCTVLFFNVLFF